MSTKRGTRHDDVLSRKVWMSSELRELGGDTPLMFLAILFFLSRHADHRAYVVVHGDPDDGCKKLR